MPAFLSGLFFPTLLSIEGRRRKLSEMSVARVTVLGVIGGLLVGFVPAAMVLVGSGHAPRGYFSVGQ